MPRNPYLPQRKRPRLLQSWVLYADNLGWGADTRAAFRDGAEQAFLERRLAAIQDDVQAIRDAASNTDFWTGIGFPAPALDAYSVKVFTDNLLIGYPWRPPDHDGESELGSLLGLIATYQTRAVLDRRLIRGAIAAGRHFMSDDMVFGDALLDAVKYEEKGVHVPAIAIHDSATRAVARINEAYNPAAGGAFDEFVWYDSEACMFFVNYLCSLELHHTWSNKAAAALAEHRAIITSGLMNSDANVRSKYIWMQRYHNEYITELIGEESGTNASVLENLLLQPSPSRRTMRPIMIRK